MKFLLSQTLLASILLSSISLNAQQILLIPKLPEAGKSLRINYTPKENLTHNLIYAYIYVITDQAPMLIDGFLYKKGKNYQGKIQVPASSKALYIYFYNDNYFDNNYQHGYSTITRGNEATGNIRLLSEKILNEKHWSPNTYFPDLDSYSQQQKELYQNKWGVNEWISYYDIRNYYDEDFSYEDRAELLKNLLNNSLTKFEAEHLKDRLNQLNEHSFNKQLDSIIGNSSKSKSKEQIQITRNVSQAYPAHKKLEQFKSFYDTLSKKNQSQDFVAELSTFIVQQYIQENKYDSAFYFMNIMNLKKINDQFASSIIQSLIAQHPKNEKIIRQIDDFIIKTTKISIERLPFENISQHNYKKNLLEENATLLNAIKQISLGNKLEAASLYKNVFDNKIISLNNYANHYIPLILENKQYLHLEELWKESYYQSSQSNKLDELIRELSDNNLLSFKNIEEEKSKIKQELLIREAENVAKKLSKVKAPNFNLIDENGNTVTLESLKGKKVMIDFWATWCTFCKASFPELKTIQSYFEKNDPSVKFVFIQTMERGNKQAKKEEGDKYLKDQQLPFYNLFDDHNSMYSKKYYLNSIPAKIFIDPNGNFVYKAIGFKSGYDKNLAEFIAIFNAMDQ